MGQKVGQANENGREVDRIAYEYSNPRHTCWCAGLPVEAG